VLLPRQERAHGRWTWLIHGGLWALFHAPFYPWQVIALLPICLAIAWVCQRRQSTTPGLVLHTLANGTPFVFALLMALGVIA
jgi:membrane protease YdiL (CAAX protease family)